MMTKQDSDIRDKIVFGEIQDWTRDHGGCKRFESISLEGLKLLLEKKMIDPEMTQNSSPSIADFMGFMEKYPNVVAHGYVVTIDRPDCRVSLEGLRCKPEDVTPEMKDAFIEFCRLADEFEFRDCLYSWWD